MKIKLAIADDQQLFRQGLLSLLGDSPEIEPIICVQNGLELLNAIREQKPDVVLLDLEMPVMCGIDATEHLQRSYPEIKIIILSMHNDESLIKAMLEKGVHEYLLKDMPIESILPVIHYVMKPAYDSRGNLSKSILEKITQERKIKPAINPCNLSRREMEVARELYNQQSGKEISDQLNISIKTVDRHKENIMKKIGASKIAGIITYLMRNNLIK